MSDTTDAPDGDGAPQEPAPASAEPAPAPQRPHTTGAVAFFTAILLASIVAVGWLFSSFVTDFLFAFLFTGLLAPVFAWLTVKLKGRRMAAAAATSVVLVIVIAVPVTFIITSLTVEAHALYVSTKESVTVEKLEGYLFGDGVFARNAKKVAKSLGVDYSPDKLRSVSSNVMGTAAGFLYERVNKLLSNTLSFLFHFIVMVLVVFYMLLDGDKLKRFLFELSPLPDEEEELIAQKFKSVGRGILFGNGMGSLIQGVLGAMAMAVAGLPSPVVWGTVMTVFAFLPLVGISVVVVPATGYLLLHEHYATAVVFFAFCAVLSLTVENVVKTRLIGSHVQMHNLLIFMSILGGIAVFGVLGILYGPLIVAMFLTVTELYGQHYRPRILGKAR